MRWHCEHERATRNWVLNASTAWGFAIDGGSGSKLKGAAWTPGRWSNYEVVDPAIDLCHGPAASLDAAEVDALLDQVEHTLVKSE